MIRRHSRRQRQGEEGAVVVEFAIVFVLFVTLLWGLLTYGLIFAVQQTLTHAAAEAARASVGIPTQAAAQDHARAILDEQLDWLGGLPDGSEVDPAIQWSFDWKPCGDDIANPGPQCFSVRVSHLWDADHALLPLLFDLATPDEVTGAAVLQSPAEAP